MVKINGQETDAQGMPLLAYVEAKGFRPDRIAVELNGCIVRRSTYGDTILHDGDSLEIVHFVGGG